MTLAVAAVLVPLVIAALVAAFRTPIYSLLPAYAALLPYGSGLTLPIGLPPSYSSLSTLVGFSLIVALAVRAALGGRSPRRLPPSLPVWLLLLGLMTASTLWSVSPDETIATLLVIAGVVVLFLLLAITDIDARAVARTETAAILGGAAACCYGLYQAFTGTLPSDGLPNSSARFGIDLVGDNHIAVALLVPLAIALDRATSTNSVRRGVLNGLAVALLLAGIVLSGSRTGLVGAMVVFVTVLLYARRRQVLVGLGVVGVVAVIVVIVFNPGGVGQRQKDVDDSGRADIFAVGATACDTYCGVGSGWGTFGEIYERTQAATPEAKVLVRATRYAPHNNWLLLIIEVGVAGVVLLCIGFVLTIWEALRLPRHLRGAPLGALLGVLVSGYFLSNFEFKYFWFALVFVMLVRNAHERDEDVGPPARLRPLRLPAAG